MRGESGFAAIEASVAIAFAMTLLVGGLSVTYAMFAKTWLERSSYETSICLASDETTQVCENLFRSDVADALPMGRIEKLELRRNSREVSVKGSWVMGEALRLRIRDQRRVPLALSGEPRRWR